ncbi:MAG: hypothetical protein K2H23_06470, partial [Oscillospiraceae bacterium]|nr:hypothetical protein [Oscillospiraceae bacterium]
MSLFKKITAAGLAAAAALSLTSCGKDTTWGAEIDGVNLSAGMLIFFQSESVSEAQNIIREAASAETASADAGAETEAVTTVGVLDSIVENKPAREWIQAETVEKMQEYAAVENKFDELGLTFEDKEDERISIITDQWWEYIGEYYEEIGVSKDSYYKIGLNSEKRAAVFNYYYGEGGEMAVPEEDIISNLKENNTRIKYISMPLKDGEGNLLKSDGKAELKTMAEGYIDRMNTSSVTFEEIEKEYNDYYADLVKAATETDEENTDIEEQTELEEDTAADEPDYGMVISKESAYLSEKLVEQAFSMTVGYAIVEDDDNEVYYLLEVMDLFADPDYL